MGGRSCACHQVHRSLKSTWTSTVFPTGISSRHHVPSGLVTVSERNTQGGCVNARTGPSAKAAPLEKVRMMPRTHPLTVFVSPVSGRVS